MKNTVLAHHWLTGMRGGERVLEEIVSLFPDAPVFTLIHRPAKLSALLASRKVEQSWLGQLPGSASYYRQALPLHPAAIQSMKLPDPTELLVSSDAALMKGLPVPPGCRHICYCHSPPRYLWDMQESYLQSASHSGFLTRTAFRIWAEKLRAFDLRSSEKVDHFIANSSFTAARIKRFYGRESTVIYPPVDTGFFRIEDSVRDQNFLVVSSLAPYKRIDLAVMACNKLKLPLTIIGDGPEKSFLQSIAGPTICFAGRQSDEFIRSHYQKCRALIFPTLEDFGMVPVEAQACGCPVIAYGAGGALESITAGQGGIFFEEQSSECLISALERFIGGALPYNPEACRASALPFSKEIFKTKILLQLQVP